MGDIGEINEAYDDDLKNKYSENIQTPPQDLSTTTPYMIYGPNESRRMLKNVFLISFSFTFLFTAFQSMASLQSSLNQAVSLAIT